MVIIIIFNQFPHIHPSVSMWNWFQGLQQISQFADAQVSLYKMLQYLCIIYSNPTPSPLYIFSMMFFLPFVSKGHSHSSIIIFPIKLFLTGNFLWAPLIVHAGTKIYTILIISPYFSIYNPWSILCNPQEKELCLICLFISSRDNTLFYFIQIQLMLTILQVYNIVFHKF